MTGKIDKKINNDLLFSLKILKNVYFFKPFLKKVLIFFEMSCIIYLYRYSHWKLCGTITLSDRAEDRRSAIASWEIGMPLP